MGINLKPYKTLDALQGLRGIAFVAIFASHSILPGSGLGEWGVSVFLMLSGFVMMYSYLARGKEAKGSLRFAWGKIKGIYPLHVCMLLLSIAYSLYFQWSDLPLFIAQIVSHAAMVQTWLPFRAIYSVFNSPSWYLGAAFFCYATFPFVLRCAKRIKKRTTVYWIITALLVIQAMVAILGYYFGKPITQDFSAHWGVYFFPPSRVLDFAIGCCLGYLFTNSILKTENAQLYTGAELAAIGLAVVSLVINAIAIFPEAFCSVLLFTPSTMAILWVMANKCGLLSKLLAFKPLVCFGGG